MSDANLKFRPDLSNSSDGFLSRDEQEPDPVVCEAYENKALEVETQGVAKTTNL